MDWGLSRLGGDAFRIKYISIARIESENSAPDTSEKPTPSQRS